MSIPLYGQNKEGSILNVWADSLKVVQFSLTHAASTTNANNDDTGYDIPADYFPVFSTVKNTSTTIAMAATTCRLDMETSETHLTGDLNALAAEAVAGYWIIGGLSAADTIAIADGMSFTAAKNIVCDGNMFSASSTCVLDYKIWCLDAATLADLDLSAIPG